MPRQKIYKDARRSFTLRLNEDVYLSVQNRLSVLGNITMQNYFEHLIADDLIVAEYEAKKNLIKTIKGGRNEI